MAGRLFEVDRRPKRKGATTALVLIVGCPYGHGPLVAHQHWQPALFAHGGYGATRRTTWRECPAEGCRYSVTTEVTEVNPRPYR